MTAEQKDAQKRFFDTARERYRIFQRKSNPMFKGMLTTDAIFKEFRFCNVFREDDKVTKWFRENIRNELMHDSHSMQIRAAVAFRWFNLPETGALLKPWLIGDELMCEAEARIAAAADVGNILNAAYMIKSPPGMRKTKGIFDCLKQISFEALSTRLAERPTLEYAVGELVQFPYLGPFMAYQSVCDLRFTPVLDRAVDINSWTAPGPGSARGIGRIFHGNSEAYRYTGSDRVQLIERMQYLLALSRGEWPDNWPKWELSTVQHWACEFDKYERTRLGEGKPKQRYRPAK